MSVSDIKALRWSSDDLPVADRLPIWHDVFGRALMKVDFEPVPDRPFRQVGSIFGFDNLGVTQGETNGFLSRRTKAQLADSDDDLIFHVNLSGFSLASQMGRELRLEGGEAALFTCAETHSHDFPEAAHALAFRFPRHSLASLVADPESLVTRRVPANSQTLRLLASYASLAIEGHVLAAPDLRQVFATHVHDLIALAVGATRDATEVATSRGLRAARLNAIKADVAHHLADETLSVSEVARRHQVTPRYVQMLFEDDGRTFTEFVIERRLTQAHRMLTGSQFTDRTISAIAFEVGFANLSYFNRVFRRRYGASPSDVRETARRG